MNKWLVVCVLALLVLVSAVGIGSLFAGGGLPVPPTPYMAAGGGLPVPPTPYLAGGGLPVPPTPYLAGGGLPVPPTPYQR